MLSSKCVGLFSWRCQHQPACVTKLTGAQSNCKLLDRRWRLSGQVWRTFGSARAPTAVLSAAPTVPTLPTRLRRFLPVLHLLSNLLVLHLLSNLLCFRLLFRLPIHHLLCYRLCLRLLLLLLLHLLSLLLPCVHRDAAFCKRLHAFRAVLQGWDDGSD